MNLWQIDMLIEDCVSEDGEIIDIDKLETLELERDTKIENILLWIKNLKAEAEAIKTEKMNLAKRQSICENKAEALKKYLSSYLEGTPFKTAKVSASFRRSTVVDVDIDQLMMMEDFDEYVRFKVPDPNKDAIKKALEDGKKLAGCQLIENYNLIIK